MLENFKDGYEVSNASAIALGETRDCVVRAIANACRVNYDMAHKFVSDTFGRKYQRGTMGFRTKMKELKKIKFQPAGQLSLFPEELEFDVTWLGDCPKLGGDLKNPKYTHKDVAYTVKEFAHRFRTGTYVLGVNKHALTIKDGIIVDNGDKKFEGYRRVVESAFKIS